MFRSSSAFCQYWTLALNAPTLSALGRALGSALCLLRFSPFVVEFTVGVDVSWDARSVLPAGTVDVERPVLDPGTPSADRTELPCAGYLGSP